MSKRSAAALAGLLPLLAGGACVSVPELGDTGFVEASSPTPAPRRQARPLDCRDLRSVRDFKDLAETRLALAPAEAERWSVCLCGDAARQAGGNPAGQVMPGPPAASAIPAYDRNNPAESLAQIRDWLKAHLPISRTQAAALTDCVYAPE